MIYPDTNHDWPPEHSLKARFWGWVCDVIPSAEQSRWRPLWNIAFSFYDDACQCGCWRESQTPPARRWRD